MKKADIYNFNQMAGVLTQLDDGRYMFEYASDYHGSPISLTMPVEQQKFEYPYFPTFFDGLLPEGAMLEALLKQAKIDRQDYFEQLVTVGEDLVGSVTVRRANE